jgi:hypothetical protein
MAVMRTATMAGSRGSKSEDTNVGTTARTSCLAVNKKVKLHGKVLLEKRDATDHHLLAVQKIQVSFKSDK